MKKKGKGLLMYCNIDIVICTVCNQHEVYRKKNKQTQLFENKRLTILYFPESEPKESLAVAPTS